MIVILLTAHLIATTPFDAAIEGALACATPYGAALDGVVKRDPASGRPVLSGPEHTLVSASGFFLIHYTTESMGTRGTGDSDAIPLTDIDQDGMPDYAEDVAAAFDAALATYRAMGFIDPQSDGGGDSRYDIYLSWLAEFGGVAWVDTLAAPSDPHHPNGRPSFIAINPWQHAFAARVLPKWVADLLLRQVAAHELHHAIQMSYAFPFRSWVIEGFSTFIEGYVLDLPRALPFVTDFRYAPRYAFPHYSLLQQDVTRFGYANGLFYLSLLPDMGFEAGGFVPFWESLGRQGGSYFQTEERIDQALREAGLGSLRQAYRRFTIRSLFLGEFDDGRQFALGYRYHPHEGSIRSTLVQSAGEVVTPPIESYGAAYVRVEQLPPEGAILRKPVWPDAELDWVVQYANCTTSLTAIDPTVTEAVLPGGANPLRGWLVVRHFGNLPAVYRMAWDFEPVPLSHPVARIEIVEAPMVASAQTEHPYILKAVYSDCRREDVTERAHLQWQPAEVVERKAGGRIRFLADPPVYFEARYGTAVTVWTTLSSRRPQPIRRADTTHAWGCATSSNVPREFLGVWLMLLITRQYQRRRAIGLAHPSCYTERSS